MPSNSTKTIRIAAKVLGTKYSPYYLSRRRSQNARIGSLIGALQPMQTEHPLVRVGQGADGGYLCPDDFEGITHCFSPGVSNLVLFERHLFERYGVRSFLCDAAVERPAADFPFEFDRKFVGAHNDDTFMTLDAWFHRYLDGDHETGDMLLQMDIEGAEYQTLLSAPDALLAKFRIIAIEFHHLFKMLDYVAFPIIDAAFRKLLTTHVVVHAHPNNNQGAVKIGDVVIPDVMEMAFLRRDRAKRLSPATTFPHPLDLDCDPDRQPLVLPKCWYE